MCGDFFIYNLDIRDAECKTINSVGIDLEDIILDYIRYYLTKNGLDSKFDSVVVTNDYIDSKQAVLRKCEF